MLRTFDPFSTLAAPNAVDYDIVRTEEGVTLLVDVPGVDPASVDLTIDGRSLTLKAERSATLPEGATVTTRRRRSGAISHSFHLGAQLDADRLTADVEHGVLTISVPTAESAKPRKIEVGVGSGNELAEADAA